MINSRTIQKGIGILLLLGILAMAIPTLQAKSPETFDTGKMRYGIYYVPGLPEITAAPYVFREGQPVFDVSEYKWIDKMFTEWSQAGVSMATFGYVNSAYGNVYPPDDKSIPFDEKWEDINATENFLRAAEKYDIDAFLATWLWKDKSDMDYVRSAIKEMITKYKDNKQFMGFVPPVEVAWEDFNDMARYAKSLNPGLEIMDFPFGPYSARAFGTGMLHGASPEVDIENVQYKAAPPQLFSNDVIGVRGMTQSIMGAIPEKDVLIHTHYVVEGGLPYMRPSQAHEVKQGVLLTATPYGTHLFSFLEGFWGPVSYRNGQPALWRAVEYYKGLVSVQRYAPYYTRATNTAKVAIMVPQYPVQSSPDMVERTWLHLARKQIPARFFLDEKNMGDPEVVIVPYTQGLTEQQIHLLREYTARGGKTIAITGKFTPPEYIEKVLNADANASQEDWRLAELFGFGIYADRMAETPFLVWNEPIIFEHQFRNGTGIAMSGRNTVIPVYLPDLVQEQNQQRMQVTGLPRNIIVERYEKETTQVAHELLLFLGTDKNETATGGEVVLPDGDPGATYYWFDETSVQTLEPQQVSGGVKIQLPPIRDYAGIIIPGTQGTYPLLQPSELYVEGHRGETVDLTVVLHNLYSESLSGELSTTVYEGWSVVDGQDQSYSLEPGAHKSFTVRVQIPENVEKRPRFVQFSTHGLTQRTIVMAVDGDPHKVTDREAPPENKNPYVRRRY